MIKSENYGEFYHLNIFFKLILVQEAFSQWRCGRVIIQPTAEICPLVGLQCVSTRLLIKEPIFLFSLCLGAGILLIALTEAVGCSQIKLVACWYWFCRRLLILDANCSLCFSCFSSSPVSSWICSMAFARERFHQPTSLVCRSSTCFSSVKCLKPHSDLVCSNKSFDHTPLLKFIE